MLTPKIQSAYAENYREGDEVDVMGKTTTISKNGVPPKLTLAEKETLGLLLPKHETGLYLDLRKLSDHEAVPVSRLKSMAQANFEKVSALLTKYELAGLMEMRHHSPGVRTLELKPHDQWAYPNGFHYTVPTNLDGRSGKEFILWDLRRKQGLTDQDLRDLHRHMGLRGSVPAARTYRAMWQMLGGQHSLHVTGPEIIQEANLRYGGDLEHRLQELILCELVEYIASTNTITLMPPRVAEDVGMWPDEVEGLDLWLENTRSVSAPIDTSLRAKSKKRTDQRAYLWDFVCAAREARAAYSKRGLRDKQHQDVGVVVSQLAGKKTAEMAVLGRMLQHSTAKELIPYLTLYVFMWHDENVEKYGKTLITLEKNFQQITDYVRPLVTRGEWKFYLRRHGMENWIPEEDVRGGEVEGVNEDR